MALGSCAGGVFLETSKDMVYKVVGCMYRCIYYVSISLIYIYRLCVSSMISLEYWSFASDVSEFFSMDLFYFLLYFEWGDPVHPWIHRGMYFVLLFSALWWHDWKLPTIPCPSCDGLTFVLCWHTTFETFALPRRSQSSFKISEEEHLWRK